MIAFILSLLSMIFSILYITYIQIPKTGFIWWSIPFVYITIWVLLLIIFVLFLVFISLFAERKQLIVPRKFYNKMAYHVAKLLEFIYNEEVIIEGRELVPNHQRFLLAANHQSNLDPISIVGAFKDKQVTYIMKDNLMKVPFVGRWLYAAGYLPLDRKNDRKALEVILKGVKRIEAGYSISVFPEGTRSKGPNMNEFRNGIFKVAQKAEAPILVVMVDNFYKVKWRFPFRRTKVLIKICELIPYDEIKDIQTNEIGERVKNIIQTNQDQARKKYSWLGKRER